MTVTDQIKILDDKIKSNQAQHDLDREQQKFLHCYLKIFWKSINI